VLDLGVGYVPEDRLHDGLIGSFTVAENLVLDIHDKKPFASRGSLNLGEIERNAGERVEEFDVRPPLPDAAASTLSGGNQQKVVLVSTELDEVLGLADRIAVMYRGRIAGEVPAGTPAAQIGMLMAGSSMEEAAAAAPVGEKATGDAEGGGAQ
jgi:simple sugar transport system ATP-binding protein